MNAKQVTIALDRLARHIDAELIAEASPLSPAGTATACPIVELIGDRVDIIDGFHRVAGMVAWARRRGLALDSVTVHCVTCDDAALLADAADAEHPEAQRVAIARIYAAL